MTVTINTIEINNEELQRLQQDNFLMDNSYPRLIIPQGKIRSKRKIRKKRNVTASELISGLLASIEK